MEPGQDPFENFNKSRAEVEREAAIASVHHHSNDEWKEAAFDAVCDVAADHDEFTADMVWRYLITKHPDLEVHDNRALGPVMRRVAAIGLIESTHRYEDSERISCHARSLLIWRSLVR